MTNPFIGFKFSGNFGNWAPQATSNTATVFQRMPQEYSFSEQCQSDNVSIIGGF